MAGLRRVCVENRSHSTQYFPEPRKQTSGQQPALTQSDCFSHMRGLLAVATYPEQLSLLKQNVWVTSRQLGT